MHTKLQNFTLTIASYMFVCMFIAWRHISIIFRLLVPIIVLIKQIRHVKRIYNKQVVKNDMRLKMSTYSLLAIHIEIAMRSINAKNMQAVKNLSENY